MDCDLRGREMLCQVDWLTKGGNCSLQYIVIRKLNRSQYNVYFFKPSVNAIKCFPSPSVNDQVWQPDKTEQLWIRK